MTDNKISLVAAVAILVYIFFAWYVHEFTAVVFLLVFTIVGGLYSLLSRVYSIIHLREDLNRNRLIFWFSFFTGAAIPVVMVLESKDMTVLIFVPLFQFLFYFWFRIGSEILDKVSGIIKSIIKGNRIH